MTLEPSEVVIATATRVSIKHMILVKIFLIMF